MPRYIDADELYEVIDGGYDIDFDEVPETKAELLRMVDAQPTADVVDVVRCKDCKWWKTNYYWNGRECKVCVKEPYTPMRTQDDFCSHGERRE